MKVTESLLVFALGKKTQTRTVSKLECRFSFITGLVICLFSPVGFLKSYFPRNRNYFSRFFTVLAKNLS